MSTKLEEILAKCPKYAHGAPKSLEEHILASCGKYKPGSDVLEYLTVTLWMKSEGFALTAEVGARHALVLTGLDQHPAFDPDRLEFAIRCCGGDPAEVSLWDFVREARRLRTSLADKLYWEPHPSYTPRETNMLRAIGIILRSIAQKDGAKGAYPRGR